MAVAWPKIKELSLVGDSTPLDSGITLAGLLPLAEHCFKLESLTLTIDARSMPREAAPPRVRGHVTTMHVLNSPLQDPSGVAAFLSNIFPNLWCLVSSADEQGYAENPWREVSELVQTQAASSSFINPEGYLASGIII